MLILKITGDLKNRFLYIFIFLQELIGGNILPACLGDSYKFHAAGREDIDVIIFPLFLDLCSYTTSLYIDNNMKELYSGTDVGFG